MSQSDEFYRKHEKWLLLGLFVVSYVLFCHATGARDIWAPDEDEYAQVNREMVEHGHWLYPTVNGEPYNIKPPLHNWIGSLLSLPGGRVTELTSRLPSALGAIGGVFALYFLARMLFGYRTAVLAALIFATTPLHIEFGRWIQIYTISSALLVATLALFYWGYTRPRRRALAYRLMYIPAAFGTLNMGLVNAAMPAIVIGAYLIARGEWRHILKLEIGWGVLIYFAIAAPWYVVAGLKGDYAQRLLIDTNFGRYATEFAHTRPLYYYALRSPWYFLPWLFFVPGAVWLWWKRRQDGSLGDVLFPLVWALGLFVFFSISRTKRTAYLLPAYPALALLVAMGIDRAIDAAGDLEWKLFAWPALGVFALFGVLALGFPVYALVATPDWLGVMWPLCGLLLAAAVAGAWLLRRRAGMPAALVIAGTLTLGAGYASGPVIAKLNETYSPKPFVLAVDAILPPGERFKLWRYRRLFFPYYTQRFADFEKTDEALHAWLDADEPVYVVTRERAWQRVQDQYPPEVRVILRSWVAHRYLVLLTNDPAASEATSSS